METTVKKWAKFTQIAVGVVIVTQIAILVFNLIVGPQYLSSASQTIYALNFFVANTSMTFDNFGQFLSYIVVGKDAIMLLFLIIFELIFFFIAGSVRRQLKGYLKLTLAVILQILIIVVAVLNFWLYNYLDLNLIFIMYQAWILVAAVAIQLGLLITLIVFYVKFRPLTLKEAFSKATFLSLAKGTIQTATIVVLVLLALGAIGIFTVYQVILMILPHISLQQFFDGSYYVDLLGLIGNNVNPYLQSLLQSLTVNEWFFSIKDGLLTFDVAAIDTKIYTYLTTFFAEQFNALIVPVLKILGFYLVVNVINVVYKKLKFKNDIVLVIFALIVYLKPLYIPSIDFILFTIIDVIIVIAVTIFIIVRIDEAVFKGRFIEWVVTTFNFVVAKVKAFISEQKANYAEKKAEKESEKALDAPKELPAPSEDVVEPPKQIEAPITDEVQEPITEVVDGSVVVKKPKAKKKK